MAASGKKVVRVVHICKGHTQPVTFVHDRQKRVFQAETVGFPTISVRYDTSDKKFHAFIEGGVLDVPAKDARSAFAKAAHRIWYA